MHRWIKDKKQWVKYFGEWIEAERVIDDFNHIIYYLIAGSIVLEPDIEEFGQIIE